MPVAVVTASPKRVTLTDELDASLELMVKVSENDPSVEGASSTIIVQDIDEDST